MDAGTARYMFTRTLCCVVRRSDRRMVPTRDHVNTNNEGQALFLVRPFVFVLPGSYTEREYIARGPSLDVVIYDTASTPPPFTSD